MRPRNRNASPISRASRAPLRHRRATSWEFHSRSSMLSGCETAAAGWPLFPSSVELDSSLFDGALDLVPGADLGPGARGGGSLSVFSDLFSLPPLLGAEGGGRSDVSWDPFGLFPGLDAHSSIAWPAGDAPWEGADSVEAAGPGHAPIVPSPLYLVDDAAAAAPGPAAAAPGPGAAAAATVASPMACKAVRRRVMKVLDDGGRSESYACMCRVCDINCVCVCAFRVCVLCVCMSQTSCQAMCLVRAHARTKWQVARTTCIIQRVQNAQST
jgi:hypothetical protein